MCEANLRFAKRHQQRQWFIMKFVLLHNQIDTYQLIVQSKLFFFSYVTFQGFETPTLTKSPKISIS